MLLSNDILSKLNDNLIYIIYKKISKKNNNNLMIEFHKYMNKNLSNYLINTIVKDEYYNLYSIIYNSEHILNHTFKNLNIYNICDLNQPFYNISLIPNMWNIYIDVYDMLEYFNLPSILNCDLDGLFYILPPFNFKYFNYFDLIQLYIEMLYDLAIYYSLDIHSFNNIDILNIKNYNLNYNQDSMMFKNNYYIENYDFFYIVDYFYKLTGFDFHIENDNFIITPINE